MGNLAKKAEVLTTFTGIQKADGTPYKTLGSIIKRELGITLNDLRKVYAKETDVYTSCKQLRHTIETHHTFYKRA